MANMLDYIEWRGDLSWEAVPPTEIDALIMAQLAMLRWEHAPASFGLISDLAAAVSDVRISAGYTGQNDKRLIALLGKSQRFGSLTLSDYVDELEEDKQFSAITLRLNNGMVCVSFRGTDQSITGWEEDFALAFSRPTPAQEAAARYLTRAARTYPGPLIVCGHSKGGNLAMFASSHVEDDVLQRIIATYNFDGPGLSDQVDTKQLYERVGARLKAFVPQGSIVGLMLAHPDKFTVVESNSVSLLQHDPYSWQVLGPRFVRRPALSGESARFDRVFHEWLAGIDQDDRQTLTECLFGVIRATNAQNLDASFFKYLARNNREVLAALDGLPKEKRSRVWKMLLAFAKLTVRNEPKTVGALKQKRLAQS